MPAWEGRVYGFRPELLPMAWLYAGSGSVNLDLFGMLAKWVAFP